jgi:hypothetical protein
MNAPTKKQLYKQVSELTAKAIEEQNKKELEQTKNYMVYYDGAYRHLLKVLKSAFGGTYCLIKFEHVDTAGFWFTFELVNDKTRQTYRVNHDEAKNEFIKGE